MNTTPEALIKKIPIIGLSEPQEIYSDYVAYYRTLELQYHKEFEAQLAKDGPLSDKLDKAIYAKRMSIQQGMLAKAYEYLLSKQQFIHLEARAINEGCEANIDLSKIYPEEVL